MRLHILALVSIVLALQVPSVSAGDTPLPYLTPGKSYTYKVNLNVNGLPGANTDVKSKPVDITLELMVKHKVDKGIQPGETQSVMSVLSVMAVSGEQKIQLSPSTFPQVTVLMDEKGYVTKVFGASGPGLPGLNFSNFILLLLPRLPEGGISELKYDQQWTKEVLLNDTGQAVKVLSTYKGKEKIGDAETLVIKQNLELAQAKDGNTGALKSIKGTATSNYSVSELKPLKAHAEVEVVGEDEFRAKVTIDMVLVK